LLRSARTRLFVCSINADSTCRSNPGDAFLAVVVLAAVGELRETTKSLDAAKRWFEVATVALATAAAILTLATLLIAL
jgi:hypothetical protein